MLRTLVVAVALAAAGSAAAVPLDNSGTPLSNINPLGHYGLNVPVKQGLKAITPDGWVIYVHREAKLPPSLSWQNTDTWVSALQTFSDLSSLPVTVDWNSHSIYVRPEGSPVTAPDTAKPAAATPATATSAPAMKPPVEPAVKPAAPTPLPEVKPEPVRKVSMESAFREAAEAQGFSVNWASDPILLESAPKVAGMPAEKAFRALAAAVDGKASVTVDMVTKTIDVQPGSAKTVFKEVPPALVLTVHEGQLMSSALADLAKQAGWTLRWETDQDFEAASASRIEGADLREVLERALPHMGLVADRYPDSKVFVVHTQR